MKAGIAFGALLMGGLLSTASAADMARPWAGWYGGLNAGYGSGRNNSVETSGQAAINGATVADGARPASVGIKTDGFVGGGQIGFNWHRMNRLWGVEADLQFADLKETRNAVTVGTAFPGTRNNVFMQDLDYLGTVRGRVGWTWDRTVVFATGGLAYGRVKVAADFSGPLPAGVRQFTGSENRTETGWTLGAGLEHAFARNMSAKVEYLYYDLGDTNVAVNVIPGSGGVGTGYSSSFENKGHLLRVGLNYRF